MRVLVVDDSRVSARVLEHAIRELGHEVEVCYSGPEAWSLFERERFPVVVTDWMMPDLDGPELCRRIRGLGDGDFTYIIMCTAKDEKSDRLAATEAGADDYLSKPLDRLELASRFLVAERLLGMQVTLAERNRQLVEANRVLESQKLELDAMLRRLESTSLIAEVSRNRFSQLFEGLPVACFTIDSHAVIFEWNSRAEIMFGVRSFEAVGRPLRSVLGSSLLTAQRMRNVKNVLKGKVFHDQSWDDGNRYFLVSALPLYGLESTITGGILTVVDVTRQQRAEEQIARQLRELNVAHEELRVLNQRLAALATTDALTGIPNHRALQDRLSEMIHAADRGGGLGLAMVDVDHFKLFNDEFGHQAGDEVLKAVASTLRDKLRRNDFVARYGGEEFCILFKDVDEAKAKELSERLRRAIAQLPCEHRAITASFGVASFGPKTRNAAMLLRAADEALYAAKEQGRNRVVAYSEMNKADAA